MKVMIGYDGSSYADDAIEDLRRAGLPSEGEALIVSVVDMIESSSPPTFEFDLRSLASRRAEAVLSGVKDHIQHLVEETKELAAKTADRLRSQFTEWKIDSQVLRGKPAEELLRKAAELKPDLIVVGTQGRGAIGRFLLGSVSKTVAEEAKCSVRVGRRGLEGEADRPIKIVAGASSLPEAEGLIRVIGGRVWPRETEVRLIAVKDEAKAIFEQSAELLAAAGLKVSIDLKSGDLKSALLEVAATCRADSIFVVADDAENELGLGEAATSLITGAKCTVEIVR